MQANKKKLITTGLLLANLPAAIFAAKTIIDIRKGAAGTPASFTIDASRTMGPITRALWQNLAQGGEEPTDMIGPVAKLLRPLEVKLIRVDHLFDYYQVFQGPGNYDFSRLDQVVNSIVAVGAKPMLSLSYTTASMAKNGQNAGEPADWNQWYELVKATARRYSIDKGISGIYYEVWNEPDLFGGWHYGKSPSYTTLYIQSARAVMNGAGGSNYKLGGPATTALYTNWIKSILSTAASNNLRLDFISWHRYSKNIDDFEKDFDTLNGLLYDYPQFFNVEKIITEAGPNPEPDSWYDNSLSASHLISLSIRLSGRIHKMFTFEAVDGPSPRSDKSTGWGIIKHSSQGGQPKPASRYAALLFLNRLQGQRLYSIGDGSWVTSFSTKNNQTIQTLIANYDPRHNHSESVPIRYQNLTPGNYKLTVTNFPGGRTSNRTISVAAPTYQFNPERTDPLFYLEPNTSLLLELTPQ